MKYAIGYIAGETVHSLWVDCLRRLDDRDRPQTVWVPSGPILWRARNSLAKAFLETGVERLLMLDTDIIFRLDQVDALLAHDEPVVGGIYGTSSSWSGSLEIVLDGTGFILIHRAVLEALMPRPFDPIVIPDGNLSGEDMGFRVRAERAGFEVLVDTNIRVVHIKTISLGIDEVEGIPEVLKPLETRIFGYKKEFGE